MSTAALHASGRLAQQVSADARSIIISVNPRAGARCAAQRVQPVEEALVRHGYNVLLTSELGQVESQAAEWFAAGQLRAVLAAGGDGTASAVRNVIPPGAPLLPLPLGTECLFAKYIGQTSAPAAVCDAVGGGLTVQMDLGRANSRLFLLMVSVGFDATVVHRMQSARTGNITHAAYVKPTLQTIRSYQYPELRVHCGDDDVTEPVHCRWILGFNLPCYARGLPFARRADSADGLIDVCMFERGSLWHTLRYLWNVARERHHTMPDVELRRWSKFRVEAADGEDVAVQVDGDRAGALPIDVEVLPGGLTLLVSPHGAKKLGFHVPSTETTIGQSDSFHA